MNKIKHNTIIITGPAEHLDYLKKLDDQYEATCKEEVTAESIYLTLMNSSDSLHAIQASLIEDVDNLRITAEEAIDISFRIVRERFERHMSMLQDNINNLFD